MYTLLCSNATDKGKHRNTFIEVTKAKVFLLKDTLGILMSRRSCIELLDAISDRDAIRVRKRLRELP